MHEFNTYSKVGLWSCIKVIHIMKPKTIKYKQFTEKIMNE
ncbi:hypothetical protein HBNCFIEN_03243 [Legionella sp. PC997]|nr:hypothetical protein HBNCFIEN_03243 [Legionella sp. PC997]